MYPIREALKVLGSGIVEIKALVGKVIKARWGLREEISGVQAMDLKVV